MENKNKYSIKRIFLYLTTLIITGSFSHSALASLDGTFSGSVNSDIICIAPFVPLISFPGSTYSLQATPATPPFSTVTLSFSDPPAFVPVTYWVYRLKV